MPKNKLKFEPTERFKREMERNGFNLTASELLVLEAIENRTPTASDVFSERNKVLVAARLQELEAEKEALLKVC